MAKATDGLAFGTTRHCRIVACRPPGSARAHKSLCNLQCILLMVLKNIVFYGVSGPSAFRNFILALSKNRVLRGFGVQGGPRNGKNDMLKVFKHSSAQFVDMMGRHRATIGPT